MHISYGLILFPLLAFVGALINTESTESETEPFVARTEPTEDGSFEAETVGPSGELKKPKGGTIYSNRVGKVGLVEVLYIGVSDGSNMFGARTCGIDLHLVPESDMHLHQPFNASSPTVTSLAVGMRPHDSGSDQPIWASFVPPTTACGRYRLFVVERQLFEDRVITFRSAAPLITFECGPNKKVLPTITVNSTLIE